MTKVVMSVPLHVVVFAIAIVLQLLLLGNHPVVVVTNTFWFSQAFTPVPLVVTTNTKHSTPTSTSRNGDQMMSVTCRQHALRRQQAQQELPYRYTTTIIQKATHDCDDDDDNNNNNNNIILDPIGGIRTTTTTTLSSTSTSSSMFSRQRRRDALRSITILSALATMTLHSGFTVPAALASGGATAGRYT
jgi:hypothetical protein